jgi:tetratricopeptide (TPR) repeat protein
MADFSTVESAMEACEREPDNWLNHLHLARAAVTARGYIAADGVSRFTVARRALSAAGELAPDEAAAHFALGQAWREFGDLGAARTYLLQALTLDPTMSGAMNELGQINLQRGRAGKAALYLVRAARSDPTQASYGRNIELAVSHVEATLRGIVKGLIYGSWAVAGLAIASVQMPELNWPALLLFLGVVASVLAVIVTVQLRRLPEEGRALFSGGYLALALSVAFSSLAVGVPTARWAIVTHRSGLVLVAVFLVAARFGAFAILRRGERRRREQLALLDS